MQRWKSQQRQEASVMLSRRVSEQICLLMMRGWTLSVITSYLNVMSLLQTFYIHAYVRAQREVLCVHLIPNFCFAYSKLPFKCMKFCYFSPKRWTVCCCMPLQWRGTSWNCRNAIYWEGLKWAMSGRQASTALIVSVPLIHSGRAAVHFYREHLPTRQSHVQTQHSSSGTMEPYQPAMKLLFTIKPAVIWKKVHNRKRYECDLK